MSRTALTRFVIPLAIVAAVVAANQVDMGPSASAVLGTKLERCTIEGATGRTAVQAGSRVVYADAVSMTIADGKPGAVLAPSTKLSPGPVADARPVEVSIGVTSPAARRLRITMTVRNAADCPAAISIGRVMVKRGPNPATVVPIRFGARDTVVVRGGGRALGRVEIPLDSDGPLRVDGSAYANLGASS